MEPKPLEIKDNCEQIIMKYYIENKEMKLIDFTRKEVGVFKSFENAEIPIIDETMKIEDILKKAPGYDMEFNDETFVIEMTFEKKNFNETKLIEFKRRELQKNETLDKYPTIIFDENENPTNTNDILFKNTKKYKQYLEFFKEINIAILSRLNIASTIEYLKSIKSTYDAKGDVINEIYNKMINEQSIDNNHIPKNYHPILKHYYLIIISIRRIINSYDILSDFNKKMNYNINIFKDDNDYNFFKTKINDPTDRKKILNDIDAVAQQYFPSPIYNDKDLPFFEQLIAEINIKLGDTYHNFIKNKKQSITSEE